MAETVGLTASQSTDNYQMWNSQDWFDNVRWGLTGTQNDSDWKAGLWWADGIAMKSAVPTFNDFADQWDEEIAKLKQMKSAVDNASQTFANNTGANAARTTSALADISRAVGEKLDQLQPVPNAIRNAAAVIDRNAPVVQAAWDRWENDRGTAEKCHQDTLAMQPAISNMAQAFLDAANAIQAPWKTSLNAPTITVPSAINGGSSIDPGIQAHLNSGPAAGQPAQLASAMTPAAHTTPGVIAASGGTGGGAGHTGSTAGTVVSNHGSTGPTLAGSGFGSSFAGTGGGGAAGGIGGAGGAGGGGGFAGSPGAMPAAASTAAPTAAGGGAPGFMPGGFLGAGMGGAGGSSRTGASRPAPAGGTPLFPVTGDDAASRSGAGAARGGVVPPPLIGGMGAGGATGRRGSEIRPGNANRPTTSGVAEGLLGRAAKNAEFSEVIGSTRRRRPNKRQDRDQRETVQFLDEEAWLTEDPGSGVVTSDDKSARSNVTAPRFGTPSVG